jgi:signal transduction histidine kinase/CheY-like chemotaxis protein
VKKFDWATFIRQHPVLSGLDDPHVQLLLLDEASTEHTYEAGDVIIREGDVGESVFLIGSGSVEVVLSGGGGQTIVLSVLPSGETFGEMGLIERRPRCATVRACKPCVILEIKGEDLRRLAEARPELEFTVLLKVSERLRSSNEQVLALHLKGIEGANRAKDEFLAMLGHELRNPLGAISNAVAILQSGKVPRDTGASVQAIISRQLRHLRKLVDDLLDVARLTSGKITIRPVPIDLRTVVDRCVATIRSAGRGESHDIRVEGGPALVLGDPVRLEQVVDNLVDNSVKYTPPDGQIRISVKTMDRQATVTVRDTGVGIGGDLLPRVFELFTQAPQGVDRRLGGLGIGLAIVKAIVELHGGTVHAQSSGPGGGTDVTVRLPLAPARLGEPRPAEEAPARSERRYRVLIVEDNDDARETLRILLELNGHHVELAPDGLTGLDLALRMQPDVALIDLGLPGLDGYDLARRVRAAPGGSAIRLIAVTGYSQPQDRRRAREAGFESFLVKPVDGRALEGAIHPA